MDRQRHEFPFLVTASGMDGQVPQVLGFNTWVNNNNGTTGYETSPRFL
jgi:hypothetical protein